MPRNYEEFVKEVNSQGWDYVDECDYIDDYTEDGTEWDDVDEDTEEY